MLLAARDRTTESVSEWALLSLCNARTQAGPVQNSTRIDSNANGEAARGRYVEINDFSFVDNPFPRCKYWCRCDRDERTWGR